MGDGAGPPSEGHGFWSPSRGVQLTFVGVLIAAVTLYVTVVPRDGQDEREPRPPATVTTGQASPPPPDDRPHTPTTEEPPVDVEAEWRREQGDLCDRHNAAAAKLPTVWLGEGLQAAAPNARAGARAVRELVRDSAALAVPTAFTADARQMISFWSQSAVHLDAMARAAESGDETSFAAQEAQLERKMRAGMGIASGLGATQCV